MHVRRCTRRIVLLSAIVAVLLYAARLWYSPCSAAVNLAGPSNGPIHEQALRTRVRVPPGFEINTFSDAVPRARVLRFTSAGDLLVSSPGAGEVRLLERDADGDGRADGHRVLLGGLNKPTGLALHAGWLFIGEADAIARVPFDAGGRTVRGTPERIITKLATAGHWTKTVGVGPDGWLYVSVGSSCNACVEEDSRRAALTRFRLDGTGEERYATGLRNSVGLAWQPGTGDLYATDNGRDFLGDDFPPCELNRIVRGGFYGWPLANGNRVADPDFGKGNDELIAASIPPAHGFGAHVAPLGIAFYAGTAFPERYHGAAFVALHGSWNRTVKSGYKVVALFFESDGSIREEDFVTGFEQNGDVIGRPADVTTGPDGALYVSDDFAGAVYRVAYRRP